MGNSNAKFDHENTPVNNNNNNNNSNNAHYSDGIVASQVDDGLLVSSDVKIVIVTPSDVKEQLEQLPVVHKEAQTCLASLGETDSLVSSISDPFPAFAVPASPNASADITSSGTATPTGMSSSSNSLLLVKPWCGTKFFSDYIQEGLLYQNKDASNVIMLFESPSSSSTETSFFNSQVFNYHDYPSFPAPYKTVLAPLRYSVMNGSTYPCYLKDAPPAGLLQHWMDWIPDFHMPAFTPDISDTVKVCAYLPVEHLDLGNHIQDPHIHYHLAGKDAIHLMTPRTTKMLANTKDSRPCVAKVTHAMGSKGIFVIQNDADEVKLNEFLAESGNPNFIVTDFVDIARNVACHFFIHPNGEVTWFGSNENVLLPNGDWSTDSTIVMSDQEVLKEMQMPFVQDVVKYCRSLGFWGSCGIDVLFDHNGQGHLVDVNPRVTGTCPALMIAQLLQAKYNFGCALFRRTRPFHFRGTESELLEQVHEHNQQNCGRSRIVLHSYYQNDPTDTSVNIAVYGHSLEECQAILDQFAPAP